MARKAKEKVVNDVEETVEDKVVNDIEEQVEEKVSAFKVIQSFKDKNTLEVYAIGDTYEADSKRLKELQSKGFIVESSLRSAAFDAVEIGDDDEQPNK